MLASGNILQANTAGVSNLQPRLYTVRRSLGLFGCAITLLLALCGCSKQLYGSLDESTANQLVSTLRFDGVYADKAAADEHLWNVTVPDDQFAQAVQILERHNLPSEPFQGLGQTFKKESLVSTPTEERARLIHAMSQELERSLMKMDDVLVARVHPVILPPDPLNPKRANNTASVLIKYRAGVDMSGRESMIRALVSAGIEGVAYDDVRVLMVSADKSSAPAATSISTPFSAHNAQGGIPTPFWVILLASLAVLLLVYAGLHWRHSIGRAVQAIRQRMFGQRVDTPKRPHKTAQGTQA